MNIHLIGAGMDCDRTLTSEAREALREADVIIGAKRLVDSLPESFSAERIVQAFPDKVAETIHDHPHWQRVAVVLSGDVGFYSGARRLVELLADCQPILVPGLSTPQYFAAKLKRPWQDFHLVSAHGSAVDVIAETLDHAEIFFLTDNCTTPAAIAAQLCTAGLEQAQITIGENLGSPDEKIVSGTAQEFCQKQFAALSVALVETAASMRPVQRTPGLPDAAFQRGDAPMTKRETRAVILSLLEPEIDGIYYDIGAGTGSVAVEIALQARRGRVYAIERSSETCSLINTNKTRFGVYNLEIVNGTAPAALAAGLPPPSGVFIGGSAGAMRAIIASVLGKNAAARLVVSAVTLDTLAAAVAAMEELEVAGIDVIQIAVTRTVKRAGLRMLDALNPVFLVSGGGYGRT